nr:hypothetical protein CFP56_53095 [Quercus suber]
MEQNLLGYGSNDDSNNDEGSDNSTNGSEDYNNNNEDHIEVDAEQAYSRRESNTSMVEEVDDDDVVEVDAAEAYSRRASKEPVTQHPFEDKDVVDSSDSRGGDGEGSGLEDEDIVNPDEREFVEDSSDSWDGYDEDVTEPIQMDAGVMNPDYDNEELHSLEESSSDDDIGDDTDDSSEDELKTPMGKGKGQRRTFLVFKPVAKAEHIRFENDMLFITLKQFKQAITDYVVHGGWGIRFAKNDLQRVRVVCQENCKFVAYLTKLPREKSYQLRTLNLQHTCTRSYKNPRCTSSYSRKKLMKRVRRQPNMKLKDIQDAVHEKFTLNITPGKAKLRRASLSSTILMKVHTFNEGDLVAEMDLLESIKLYLMTRFQENRQKIMKVESKICPKVLKRLPKENTNMWRPSGVQPVQPPIKRIPPGRPKKKRVREVGELADRRAGISKQCRTCGKIGHNKRSCKDEIRGNSSLPGTINRTSAANKMQKLFQHQSANRTSSSLTKLSHPICITPAICIILVHHVYHHSWCTNSAMDKLSQSIAIIPVQYAYLQSLCISSAMDKLF